MKRFFVISLPRTGTASLCKMAELAGLTPKHNPGMELVNYINSKYNFFADTPCYLKTTILELSNDDNNYFIYCDRNVNEWVRSFNAFGVPKTYINFMNQKDDGLLIIKSSIDYFNYLSQYLVDLRNSTSIDDGLIETYNNHNSMVTDLNLGERLLMYKFSDGWKTFCNFTETNIPNNSIPHLHKTKI